MLGPGATLNTCREQIDGYIRSENPYVISINFISRHFHSDMVFLSNRKRLDAMGAELARQDTIVATSNLTDCLPQTAHFVNYASFLGEGLASDNAGAMLIRILKAAGTASIALAGLDGFDVDSANNYCVDSYRNRLDREEADTKNQNIGRQLRLALAGASYQFLTPTKYEV